MGSRMTRHRSAAQARGEDLSPPRRFTGRPTDNKGSRPVRNLKIAKLRERFNTS